MVKATALNVDPFGHVQRRHVATIMCRKLQAELRQHVVNGGL